MRFQTKVRLMNAELQTRLFYDKPSINKPFTIKGEDITVVLNRKK